MLKTLIMQFLLDTGCTKWPKNFSNNNSNTNGSG